MTSSIGRIENGLQLSGVYLPITHTAREKGCTVRASMSWDGTKKRLVKRIAAIAVVMAVLAPTAAFAKPSTTDLTTSVVDTVYSLARGSSWS